MRDTPVKIVIAGEMGVGKTTALRAIADAPPVDTEVPISGGPIGDKTTTTVAFDFSTVRVDDDMEVHVYGLPGQKQFDFMRPIVCQGALGVILLLDATDPEIAGHCRDWVDSLRAIDPALRMVVGVTKSDLSRSFSLRSVRQALAACGTEAPIVTCDARDPEQCLQLMRILLVSIGETA